MANRRFIDFPIASTSGDTDIILIWQGGANKQTTKATFLSGLPTDLEDLNDVVISGLTNGQILRYDSVTGKWENTDQGNLDLNDLNDVSIVSPSNGQVLVYNSSTSQWENSSGGYVPYVGAVTTVDLGAQGLRAGYVRFDTTVASVPQEQGLMFWDADDETVDVILNGYTMKIGEDLFYPVKNQTGSTIAKGVAVRFNGTVGASGRLLIAPFIADGSVPSSRFMGVTAEEILNGEDGKVLYFGRVRGINTDAFNEGDILYASTTVAGGFQTAIPVAPNNIVQVAAVVTKSATVGTIFVRPTLGSNINKDEGVKIVSVADKNLLQYQSGTGLWENKTIAQVLGGTSSQFVKGDGSLDSTTYQSTADKGQPNGYASLDGNGKVPLVQINDALIGNVNFQGLWNASTNTPTLVDPPSSGTKGYYYIVSTGGTFAGITFEVGDWIISNGTAWGKVDNTDAVSSVFGRTGNVVASNGDYTTAQVTESGNLYYTDARSRAALSFAAGSGAYNSSTGVITIPTNNNQIANGAGYITAETDTLQSVILRNGTTNTGFTISNTNDTYVNPGSTNVPFIYLYNTGTTSTSNSVLSLRTNSATGGDPILSFDIKGVIGWSMGIDNSDDDRFKIANSWNALDSVTRLTITSGGNLLVGTTSDNGARLQVSGTATIGSGTQGINTDAELTLREGVAFVGLDFKSARTSGNIGGLRFYNTSDDFVPIAQQLIETDGKFVFRNGTSAAEVRLTIASTGEATFSSSVTAGSFIKSGGTSAQFLKANGSVDSTSYQPLLTNPVTGTGTTNYLPKFTGSTTIGNSIVTNNGSVVSVINGTLALSNAFNLSGRNAANTINIALIGRNSSDRVIIDADGYGTNIGGGGTVLLNPTGGNVGIGTSTPSVKLQVDSGSIIASFRSVGSGQNNKQIVLRSGGDRSIIEASNASDGTDTALAFNTGSNERMRITSAGKVGIGTITPSRNLEVVASLQGVASFRSTNLDRGFISLQNGNTTDDAQVGVGANGNNLILLAGGAAERMRITSTGNVGIGTAAPAFANGSGLEIERAGISTLRLQNTTGSNSFELYVDSAANGITFYGANSSSFIFSPAATERWRITTTGIFQSNGAQTIQTSTGNLTIATGGGNGNIVLSPNGTGNVGIGITTPTSRLDIGNGTLTLPTLRGRTYTLTNVSSANPNFINGTGFNSIPVRVGDIIDLPFSQTRTVTAVTDTQLTVDSAWTTSFAGVNVEGRGAIVFQTNNLDRLTISGTGNVLIGTTTSGASIFRIVGLPTSSAGLSSGDVWNDSGTLKIA